MTKKHSSLALCICSTLAFSPSLSYASSTVSNSQWENNSSLPYNASNPYEIALFSAHNGEDKARLWSQTQSIIGYGLGVAGFLALLPSDFTNWDKSDDRLLENGMTMLLKAQFGTEMFGISIILVTHTLVAFTIK